MSVNRQRKSDNERGTAYESAVPRGATNILIKQVKVSVGLYDEIICQTPELIRI